MHALRTDGLSKHWGAFKANDNIGFSLAPGARHALIGPNGAGKTTFVNLLTGALAPTHGRISLNGVDVTNLPQHRRVKLGMTRTFQINTLFPALTVLESVLLAICERTGRTRNFWRALAHCTAETSEALALLERLRLRDDADTECHSLPYGKQRLLEIALALATQPTLLLLDEPAAGVPTANSREIFAVLSGLPRSVTVLFIEHDMDLVFRFAERITVLVGGTVLFEGTPEEVSNNKRVQEVYLGESAHD